MFPISQTGESPSRVGPRPVEQMPNEAITQITVSVSQIGRRIQGCRMTAGGTAGLRRAEPTSPTESS